VETTRYLNLFMPFVCPTDLGSRRRIKSGLCAGVLSDDGSKSSCKMVGYEVRDSGERPSSAPTRWVGMCEGKAGGNQGGVDECGGCE
jgi:hypothetical protein